VRHTARAERSGRKERKFATALFADLVGSTTPAEREDPEVVQSIVGRTFDRVSVEIGRYEGLRGRGTRGAERDAHQGEAHLG
jgi:class 3 adenylate cyclase